MARAALTFSALLSTSPAGAATVSNAFTATLTILPICQITSTSSLDFGTQGVLTASIKAQANIAVLCTDATPFNVGLDAGSTPGGSVSTRLMGNGADAAAYQLYSNAGHSTAWGNTAGTDTVSGTGTGAPQSLTIYGQVLAQTTPAPGTYADTITVTITY